MDELDLRLRAMAHREAVSLPPECGALLERLEGEIRRGEDRRPRRRLGRRTLLLAAAVAVLSASVLAAELWHLRIEEVSVGQEESGYWVDGDIPAVPQEAFSHEIWSIMEKVPEKAAGQNSLLMSTMPGYWFGTFDSWRKCEDFVGFPLRNPLEEAELLEMANYAAIPRDAETLDENRRRHCAVTLNGSATGELQSVQVDAGYLMGEIRIQMSVYLYPEGSFLDPGTGAVWIGEADFTLTSGVTGSKVPYSLVVTETPENDYYHDFSSADAYFILENGLYTLHAVSPGRESGGAAKSALEELLKLF